MGPHVGYNRFTCGLQRAHKGAIIGCNVWVTIVSHIGYNGSTHVLQWFHTWLILGSQMRSDVVAELVELRHPLQKVRHLNPGKVQSITYQIDMCRYLAWCSALLGHDKYCLAQYQNNVTE